MTRLRLPTQALLLLTTIAFTFGQDDWKPIIGSGTVLHAQPSIHYPTGIDINDGLNTVTSRSKSSITFNGQTISTAIHNTGPSLSVATPAHLTGSLNVDGDANARSLDYSRYLTGFFGPASIRVSGLGGL